MEYIVAEYDSGKPFYPLNDFIILKEKVSDDNAIPIVTELSKSKLKSVERASVLIINTRQAELDIIISTYPECTEGELILTLQTLSRNIKLNTGAVYIKHTNCAVRYNM